MIAFLASGDGGTEAQKVLAMLGLPHIQSMEKDIFPKVERAISPAIKKVLDVALKDALFEEVEETMREDAEFDFSK